MDFSIKSLDAKTGFASLKTGCIAVAVFENKTLSAAARALDKKGEIGAALKSGDITGKPGSTLLLRDVAGSAAERVLLVGLGKEESVGEKDLLSAMQAIARTFGSLGATDAIVALPFDIIKTRDTAWAVRSYVLAARDAAYRFDAMKSKKEPVPTGARKIAFAVPTATADTAKHAVAQAVAVANGIDLTKDLGNFPANVCTPTYLANTAKKIAREFKLEVEILDRKQLQALKMGSFLSVTNGSVEPPKFIVLKHLGGKSKDAPVVLVGKASPSTPAAFR
jgi:leucyl aminopeptidase